MHNYTPQQRQALRAARKLFDEAWLSGDENGLVSAQLTFDKVLIEMGVIAVNTLTHEHPLIQAALDAAYKECPLDRQRKHRAPYAVIALIPLFPDETKIDVARAVYDGIPPNWLASMSYFQKAQKLKWYDPAIMLRIRQVAVDCSTTLDTTGKEAVLV